MAETYNSGLRLSLLGIDEVVHLVLLVSIPLMQFSYANILRMYCTFLNMATKYRT